MPLSPLAAGAQGFSRSATVEQSFNVSWVRRAHSHRPSAIFPSGKKLVCAAGWWRWATKDRALVERATEIRVRAEIKAGALLVAMKGARGTP